MHWGVSKYASLAFLSVFEVAGAAPIIYDVNVSGHDAASTITLSGTITVADGKLGLLSAGDILSYNLTASGSVSINVQSVNFEGPNHEILSEFTPQCSSSGLVVTGTCGLLATPAQLVFTNQAGRSMSFPFGIGNTYAASVEFNPDSITAGEAIGCGFGPGPSCEEHSGVLHAAAPYLVGTAVPEPSDCALLAIGLTWLGFAWARGKKRFSSFTFCVRDPVHGALTCRQA